MNINLPNKSRSFSSEKEIPTVYHIGLNTLQGGIINLSLFEGKKILFVNVASKCGFTKQYKDLQKLTETYKDSLVVIGVPCNQFGKQEPGDASEIQSFCELNYGVTFLITEKIDVKGSNQHPLYAWLTSESLNGKRDSNIKWNFQKYIVNEKGELIDHYYSITSPLSKKITRHF
ncbi:MAG: glutathione peroxidase [Patiriisocius sp.]|jgi:glutathione peroxidase